MRPQARVFTFADDWTPDSTGGVFGQEAQALINLNGTPLRGWVYRTGLASGDSAVHLESIDLDGIIQGRLELNMKLYAVDDLSFSSPIGDIKIGNAPGRAPFQAGRSSAGF